MIEYRSPHLENFKEFDFVFGIGIPFDLVGLISIFSI
jgi:hypothetical protein